MTSPVCSETTYSLFDIVKWTYMHWDYVLFLISIPISIAAVFCRFVAPPKNPNSTFAKFRLLLEWLAQNSHWAESSWVSKAKADGLLDGPAPPVLFTSPDKPVTSPEKVVPTPATVTPPIVSPPSIPPIVSPPSIPIPPPHVTPVEPAPAKPSTATDVTLTIQPLGKGAKAVVISNPANITINLLNDATLSVDDAINVKLTK